MTPAEQATVVIAALALRIVGELVTEKLGPEGSLAALRLAHGEDTAAQRPVFDMARLLLVVLDGHFTKVAPLAPRARFYNLAPAVGRQRLAVVYREDDHRIAQLEQQLRDQASALTAARDTITHLAHGLEVTLDTLRGGDVDEALQHGQEVLLGAAR